MPVVKSVAFALLPLFVATTLPILAQEPASKTEAATLPGYSTTASATERDWETKFRAFLPLKTCVPTCSASPHVPTTSVRPTTKTTPNGSSPTSRSGASTRTSRLRRPLPHPQRARRWSWSRPPFHCQARKNRRCASDPTSDQQAEQLPTYNAY